VIYTTLQIVRPSASGLDPEAVHDSIGYVITPLRSYDLTLMSVVTSVKFCPNKILSRLIDWR